jgi:hypothetical protein
LPISRQRSTESIERGSANHLVGSIEKSGVRAAANDALRIVRVPTRTKTTVALNSCVREPGVTASVCAS